MSRLTLLLLVTTACSSITSTSPTANHLPGEKAPDEGDGHEHTKPDTRQAQALARGEQAPEFVLVDTTGRTRTLGEFHAAGPVIVVFYHGAWCGVCRKQLDRFQQKSKDLPADAHIIAISADPRLTGAKMVENLKLSFPVLADPELKAAAAFGVADAVSGLSLPAIFVVDKAGVVRWQHVGEDTFIEDQALDQARAATAS
jgi:peroxiredoxin